MVRKELWEEIKKDPKKHKRYLSYRKAYRQRLKQDPVRYKHNLEMHRKHEKNRRLRNLENERELARKRYHSMSKDKKQKVFENNKFNRIKLRKEVIESWGNRCQKCGYTEHPEILQFDHKIPLYRGTNGIKKVVGTKMLKEVREHPERFEMLCPNCHRIKTHKEITELWEKKKNGLI